MSGEREGAAASPARAAPRSPSRPAEPARDAPAEAAAAPVGTARAAASGATRARRRAGVEAQEEPTRDERRPQKDFGPRREPRPTPVDPDSPFAKLAALKPLLERRDKRP